MIMMMDMRRKKRVSETPASPAKSDIDSMIGFEKVSSQKDGKSPVPSEKDLKSPALSEKDHSSPIPSDEDNRSPTPSDKSGKSPVHVIEEVFTQKV